MPMHTLKPILRQFVILAAVFVLMDGACGGERVNGAYLSRRLPLLTGLSVALGLSEYRRTRRG